MITQFTLDPYFIRVVLAALAGAIIGFERILSRRTAGIRTYSLVSVGAATFMYLATQITGSGVPSMYYVLGQLVVGIGFLGAGSIIYHRGEISGLTTASGLWVTAAIGASFGLGLFTIGMTLTVMTLLVFTVFLSIERALVRKFDKGDE